MGWENPLEKEMANHFRILAGKFHGQKSPVGYTPRGGKRFGHINNNNKLSILTGALWSCWAGKEKQTPHYS